MAHLLLLRICNNLVMPFKGRIGVHQRIEHEISKRKYPVRAYRDGYNTPIASHWQFMDYRLKKEIIPAFVTDLRPINLNPTPNTISIWEIFFPTFEWFKKLARFSRRHKWMPNIYGGTHFAKAHKFVTSGYILPLIQWFFRIINEKKKSTIKIITLFILSLFLNFLPLIVISTLLLLLIPVIWFNPLKPVPIAVGKRERFIASYNYNIVFGVLNDPPEYKKGTKEIWQEDVL